jgi:hypothetical protein
VTNVRINYLEGSNPTASGANLIAVGLPNFEVGKIHIANYYVPAMLSGQSLIFIAPGTISGAITVKARVDGTVTPAIDVPVDDLIDVDVSFDGKRAVGRPDAFRWFSQFLIGGTGNLDTGASATDIATLTLSSESATAGQGNLGAFLNLGRLASGRRGAGIAAKQTGAQAYQMGVAFMVSNPGSATSDAIVEAGGATHDQGLQITSRSTVPPVPFQNTLYFSDGTWGAGAGFNYYDGANWRFAGERLGATTVATDADFTLTPNTSSPQQFHTGTLTADRAVTLSTSGALAGMSFRITRSGAGAFNLNVGTGPLKALATGQWAEFVYTGSAWALAQFGSL